MLQNFKQIIMLLLFILFAIYEVGWEENRQIDRSSQCGEYVKRFGDWHVSNYIIYKTFLYLNESSFLYCAVYVFVFLFVLFGVKLNY